MIRVVIIDDEPLALRQLEMYIGKVPFLELIGAYPSAIVAKPHVEHADIVYVDINMPDLSGLDFVRSLENPPLVVFTTAYSEYALDGFKVHAADYLLKPFGFQEFEEYVIGKLSIDLGFDAEWYSNAKPKEIAQKLAEHMQEVNNRRMDTMVQKVNPVIKQVVL